MNGNEVVVADGSQAARTVRLNLTKEEMALLASLNKPLRVGIAS